MRSLPKTKRKHKKHKRSRKIASSFSIILSIGILFFIVITFALTYLLISPQTKTQQTNGSTNTSIYYGAYVPNGFQIGTNLAQFETDAGKGMGIIPWYVNFTSGFPANTMTAIRGHGSIPELTWQPDSGGITAAYSLQNISNGTYDSYITQFAQNAKAWGHPFFLRFAHEMNGTWYGWSEQVNGNSKGQYVQMWRHVHDIFTSVGANNVTWVWCPNIDSNTATLAGLYPGDGYVDWTCMDGYNWGTSQTWSAWRTFSNLFQSTYTSLVTIAASKPIMIGETGSVEQGGNKAGWITDALTVQLPSTMPQVKAFLWFNEANTPWRIETTAQSQQAFMQGIASSYYAGNVFGTISTSPILPPALQNITGQPTITAPSNPIMSPIAGVTITPTQIPTPTGIFSPSPTVTVTQTLNDIILNLTLTLPGIGSITNGNVHPLHPLRNVHMTLYNIVTGQAYPQDITMVFNGNYFSNPLIDAGAQVPAGQYQIFMKTNGFLQLRLVNTDGTNTFSLSPGTLLTLPPNAMIAGDIAPQQNTSSYGDNILDIRDYNSLISCYGTKANTSSCPNKNAADLNDDGFIDGVDYNILLQGLSQTTNGDVIPGSGQGATPIPTPPLQLSSTPTTSQFSPTPPVTQPVTGISHYVYVFPETHIVSVYDMDANQRLVKTIALPSNVSFIRGVGASIPTHTLYIAYGGNGGSNGLGSLFAYDLETNQEVYDKQYTTGIDSFSITADGKTIYMPDGDLTNDGTWRIIDAATGNVTGSINTPGNLPHNTIVGPSGKNVYLGGRGSQYLYVADTTTNQVIQQIGPVRNGVRPFTVNGAETLAFITTSNFLGFQVGDINSGKILYTVGVNGFSANVGSGLAPSHGISLSPDEREAYIVDWPNSYVHVFDIAGLPNTAPQQVADIKMHSMVGQDSPCVKSCEKEGWVLHSRDGRFVYVGDAGDVVDTRTRTSIAYLDPLANTRKVIEIDWQNGAPIFTTTRYGLGYK